MPSGQPKEAPSDQRGWHALACVQQFTYMDPFAVPRGLDKSMRGHHLLALHCAARGVGCGCRLHRRPCHSALPAVATAGYKRVSCMPGVEALVRKQPLLQTLQVGGAGVHARGPWCSMRMPCILAHATTSWGYTLSTPWCCHQRMRAGMEGCER